MRTLKKVLSILLVIVLLNSTVPGFWQISFAAPADAHLLVDTYANGTLNLKWDPVPNRGVTVVTYHTPKSDYTANLVNISILAADPTKATITGLKSDYIYDITVNVYDNDGGTGTPIATDTLYFLPRISLYSDIVKQQSVDNAGGGRESGVMPALKISWNMPRIFNNTSFVYINNVGTDNSFNIINSSIQRLNFIINISSNTQKSDIKINCDPGTKTYTAIVSGSQASEHCDVKFDNVSGKLYFYLLGVKEEGINPPTFSDIQSIPNQVLPTGIPVSDNLCVLPDKEILPGTIYYLKLNALFTDTSDNYLNVASFGTSPSPLLGSVSYTYTPVRFELSKDSMDNINVKIYKINDGVQSIPSLYYEVQLNSIAVDEDSTWNQGSFAGKGKKINGSYINGAYIYTVISGIGVNNDVCYRIVVKSDLSSDRLQSMIMNYTLQNDISKPPVPRNVIIDKRELVTKPGNTDKSTDVTISWDKPANWDQIIKNTNPSEDIVFQILLSTSQTDLNITPNPPLEANGNFYGCFPVKYRKVIYVSARSGNIHESGSRLSYKISGFGLFQGEVMTAWDTTTDPLHPHPEITPNGDIDAGHHETYTNPSTNTTVEYPRYLLPNTVYYLQMYTTKTSNLNTTNTANMSDKSIAVSFTTLTGVERDVPLPDNLKLNKNNIDNTKINYLELQFNKIRIDWNNYTTNHDAGDKIYYDLYMSTSPETNTFKRIGTTQFTKLTTDSGGTQNTDIAFDKVADMQSLYITAKISKFTENVGGYDDDNLSSTPNVTPYGLFGRNLMPNTTYYFYIKTRLEFVNDPTRPKESIPTAILPVTTVRTDIQPGDESSKRPIAPTDFAIASDANGDLLLKGQSVSFSWTKQEDGVIYELICTSQKVASDADSSTYSSDPLYTSFIAKFGPMDYDNVNGRLTLDPIHKPALQNNLEYNATTKKCKYTIDTWLFPNKLYYFTLRTIKPGESDKYSVWVSIPVTTSLIEGPASLEPVNDSEIGFSWSDNVIDLTRKPDDYRISIKGPKDTAYKVLTRAQGNIVIDGPIGGTTNFYGRIYNLQSNTPYYVKVERAAVVNGVTTYAVVYPVGSATALFTTKDDYHQIEVKWKGLPVDDWSSFEIAVKAPDASDYTILDPNIDMENYLALAGNRTYPYYFEKTALTTGTSYSYYHAKIKSILVMNPDGSKVHTPLKANTKYNIKVRSKKTDSSNQFVISYSKYIGPVDTRTEFNQGDYNQTDEDLKNKASFLDKIAKLEENNFWRMNLINTKVNKILLKGDTLLNSIENSGSYASVLDFSALGVNVSSDLIYMPLSIARVLNTEDKSLVIKTAAAEFTFRPRTLTVEDIQEIKTVQGKTGVNDLYLKMNVTRIDKVPLNEISGSKCISKANDLKVQVLGTSKTETQLKDLFKDKMYNDTTGLIKQTSDILTSNSNVKAMSKEKAASYVDSLVRQVESDLGEYINDTIEGSNGNQGIIVATESIRNFNEPMLVKLSFNNEQGLKAPYVYYEGNSSWQKLGNNISLSGSTMTFNALKTGKYAVFVTPSTSAALPDNLLGKDSINKFTSKYDLNDVFTGIDKSFNPDLSVTGKETALLFEKILNKSGQNTSLDIKQKLKNLQLDSIINPNSINRSVNRQELAAVLVKVYANKMGVDADSLKPSSNLLINDENEIGSKYYNSCVLCLNNGLLTLDQNNDFKPENEPSRAEVIIALEKVLELTGNIK